MNDTLAQGKIREGASGHVSWSYNAVHLYLVSSIDCNLLIIRSVKETMLCMPLTELTLFLIHRDEPR